MTEEIPQDKSSLPKEQTSENNSRWEQETTLGEEKGETNKFEKFWESVSQAGLVEPVLRTSTHLLSIILVLIVAWAMRNFYMRAQVEEPTQEAAQAALLPTSTPTAEPADLPPFDVSITAMGAGIPRLAMLDTTIPTRPRVEVITYTVQTGDTVFGIAAKFALQPETIFWGNYHVLEDNPHRLQPGQVLNILPVNGTYHEWKAGENLPKVAEFYGVEPQAIVEWSGNPTDPYEFEIENPGLEPGTMLIVPGGKRALVDWGPPRIPRDNPAIARTYGPGFCGTILDGPIGTGTFIWPTTERRLSGYDYSPSSNHWGIDIAGRTGNPIFSVDAGVVVYAGWSNYGYGNLVVVDHGNSWQSFYAHLSAIYVVCGQGVFQGTSVGGLGTTGKSSGPHLHFELMYGSAKVNPWDFLQ